MKHKAQNPQSFISAWIAIAVLLLRSKEEAIREAQAEGMGQAIRIRRQVIRRIRIRWKRRQWESKPTTIWSYLQCQRMLPKQGGFRNSMGIYSAVCKLWWGDDQITLKCNFIFERMGYQRISRLHIGHHRKELDRIIGHEILTRLPDNAGSRPAPRQATFGTIFIMDRSWKI